MRTKVMNPILGTPNTMEKEEELHKGREIQAGLLAEQELERNPPVDKESRDMLLELVQIGQESQAYMFERHIKLATDRAKKLSRQTSSRYPIEDLKQDAYFALTQAIKTYDPEKSCRLSTHAFYKITKELSVKINKMRPVRLPENRMGDYLHITRAEAEYLQLNNGVIDPAEMLNFVIEKTGLSKVVIATIKSAISGTISLNAPLGEDGGEFGDLIEDKAIEPVEITNPRLLEILCKLTQFEQDIFAYELGAGQPSMPLERFLQENKLKKEDIKIKYKSIISALKRQQKRK